MNATPAPVDHPAPVGLPSTSLLPPPTLAQQTPVPMPPPIPTAAPILTAAPIPTAAPAVEPAAMVTGPSAIFSTDAAMMPPEHAVPMLPTVAAAPPRASTPKPGETPFDIQDFLDTPGPGRKAPAKKRGKWLVRLLMIALLGGGGWVAKEHGPALYEEYVRKEADSAPTETTAPLAFPNVTAIATPIRTAEFILDGLPATPGVTYRVTTDFETDVSQVDITRPDGPDLQILTYANDAMIRRADGDQWYVLERGQFPLDGRLERSDWVRRIDELLPNNVRDRAAIDASTESNISGVPTRHLFLTIDPALLATTNAEIATLPADGNDAVDDALAPPVAEPLEIGTTAPAVGDAVPTAAPVGTIAIEVWIDGDGLVRQVRGAPQLGAQTITIVRTSAEAWIPQYPAPGEILPLTASALVELGV